MVDDIRIFQIVIQCCLSADSSPYQLCWGDPELRGKIMIQTAVQCLTNTGLAPFLAVYTHTHNRKTSSHVEVSVIDQGKEQHDWNQHWGWGTPLSCPLRGTGEWYKDITNSLVTTMYVFCMLYLEPMNRSTHCTCDSNLSLLHFSVCFLTFPPLPLSLLFFLLLPLSLLPSFSSSLSVPSSFPPSSFLLPPPLPPLFSSFPSSTSGISPNSCL